MVMGIQMMRVTHTMSARTMYYDCVCGAIFSSGERIAPIVSSAVMIGVLQAETNLLVLQIDVSCEQLKNQHEMKIRGKPENLVAT